MIDAAGDVPALLWPKVACAVFGLELYIKCLHRVRRRYIEGHNVKILFAALSKADRNRVTDIYNDIIKGHPNYADFTAHGILLDIDSVLTRASDMFIKGRYWHESFLPATDANGVSSNIGVDRLSDSIRLRIFEIHPNYPERASKFKFDFAGIPLPSGHVTTK